MLGVWRSRHCCIFCAFGVSGPGEHAAQHARAPRLARGRGEEPQARPVRVAATAHGSAEQRQGGAAADRAPEDSGPLRAPPRACRQPHRHAAACWRRRRLVRRRLVPRRVACPSDWPHSPPSPSLAPSPSLSPARSSGSHAGIWVRQPGPEQRAAAAAVAPAAGLAVAAPVRVEPLRRSPLRRSPPTRRRCRRRSP